MSDTGDIPGGAMKHCEILTCSVLLVFAASLLHAEFAIADTDERVCQCRAPGGEMRALGTVECVDIAGQSKFVLCTMSTNTPYWQDVRGGDGCPAA